MYPFSYSILREFSTFLFLESLIYYLKIKLILRGRKEMAVKTIDSTKTCDFCDGNGYFQLVLGGSETCPNCEGTGKKEIADK
jgi:DnaJ-class molecular chaperone